MSYIEIYKVQKNGDVVSYAKVRNNHAYAPLIYRVMMDEYGYRNEKEHPFFLEDPGLQKMWDECSYREGIWSGDDMADARLVLMSTYDRVWIEKSLMSDLVRTLRAFCEQHVTSKQMNDETILGCIEQLERLYQVPDTRGVAFNLCSANEPFWDVWTTNPECASYEGDYMPFNVDQDPCSLHQENGKAWELGASMAARE